MTKHDFNGPYINYFLPAKKLLLVPMSIRTAPAFMKMLMKERDPSGTLP